MNTTQLILLIAIFIIFTAILSSASILLMAYRRHRMEQSEKRSLLSRLDAQTAKAQVMSDKRRFTFWTDV